MTDIPVRGGIPARSQIGFVGNFSHELVWGLGAKKMNYFSSSISPLVNMNITRSGLCHVMPGLNNSKIQNKSNKKKTSAKANTRAVISVSHTVHFTDDSTALSTGMSTTTRWRCVLSYYQRKKKGGGRGDGPSQLTRVNNRDGLKRKRGHPRQTLRLY